MAALVLLESNPYFSAIRKICPDKMDPRFGFDEPETTPPGWRRQYTTDDISYRKTKSDGTKLVLVSYVGGHLVSYTYLPNQGLTNVQFRGDQVYTKTWEDNGAYYVVSYQDGNIHFITHVGHENTKTYSYYPPELGGPDFPHLGWEEKPPILKRGINGLDIFEPELHIYTNMYMFDREGNVRRWGINS
jgi:hypothetical protein